MHYIHTINSQARQFLFPKKRKSKRLQIIIRSSIISILFLPSLLATPLPMITEIEEALAEKSHLLVSCESSSNQRSGARVPTYKENQESLDAGAVHTREMEMSVISISPTVADALLECTTIPSSHAINFPLNNEQLSAIQEAIELAVNAKNSMSSNIPDYDDSSFSRLSHEMEARDYRSDQENVIDPLHDAILKDEARKAMLVYSKTGIPELLYTQWSSMDSSINKILKATKAINKILNNSCLNDEFNDFNRCYLCLEGEEDNYHDSVRKLPSYKEFQCLVNEETKIDTPYDNKTFDNFDKAAKKFKKELEKLASDEDTNNKKIREKRLENAKKAKHAFRNAILARNEYRYNNTAKITQTLIGENTIFVQHNNLETLLANNIFEIAKIYDDLLKDEQFDSNNYITKLKYAWKNASETAQKIELSWNEIVKVNNDIKINQFKKILTLMNQKNGLFNLGNATQKEAIFLGIIWLGKEPTVQSSDKGIRLTNGNKQFRLPEFKNGQGVRMANFERYAGSNVKGKPMSNGHITIISPPITRLFNNNRIIIDIGKPI